MGMPVIGTVANIEGFTRQDLVRHVQTHYVGEKTVVVAAGNFDVPAWLEQAAQLFAGMPASADPAVALPPQPAKYVGQALAQRFTQDTFIRLLTAPAGDLPALREPRAYLATVARRLLINLIGLGLGPFL